MSADGTAISFGIPPGRIAPQLEIHHDSAVPYYYNLAMMQACIDTRVSLNDVDGHTGVIRKHLALDADAKAAGISGTSSCNG